MSNGSAHANNVTVVRSVERALRLMELLAERSWSGVTEVARELEVHKSTAFRLLATLEGRGMVEQDPETAKYRLGPGMARLGRTVSTEVDLRRQARDALRQLAEETVETVNLAVLDGSGVIYVDQVGGSSAVLGADWLGRRTPMHCTASGKVLLAFATDGTRKRLIGGELDALTPRTIVDHDLLEAQCAGIREVGFATTESELEVGLNAVAAPVFCEGGETVGAIAVSGPGSRLTAERLPAVGVQTRGAADGVSIRLGASPPTWAEVDA